MKVSLIATVKDAAPFVPDFLDSIRAQTRPPDEVVIADGGSADGTLELLRAEPWVTVLEEPGSNISRGRNVAVRGSSHEIVAVSDADCVLVPEWLERLLVPLEAGADVSMGTYRPLASTFFEECAAAISIRDPDELDEGAYMPSARSVAFTREAFEAAGGYPEWMDLGEDMYLNHRWRRGGADMRLARDAVVLRRPRPDLGAFWRQFAGYAAADAEGAMYPGRHASRFAAYGALSLALASRSRPALAACALAAAAYAGRPLLRALRRLPPARRSAALVAIPALMVFQDAAKMAGYLKGLLERGDPG